MTDFQRNWFLIVLFAASAFIYNTTEFVPIGLLPHIADALQVSESTTGRIMTIYAWTVTLLSLPLTILTAKFERKKLLLALFVIFTLAHVVTAMANHYAVFLLGRLLVACAHALFWAIMIPLAVRLAPGGNTAKALAFVVTGSSLSTVAGVPLGTAIGQHFDWRMTFIVIGVIALILMLLLARHLPHSPSQNAGSLKALPVLLKRKALSMAFLVAALTITGYFTLYSYMTPYLDKVGGFGKEFIIYVQFLMGGAGILGSYLYTRLEKQLGFHTYTLGAGTLLFCLLSFQFTPGHPWAALLLAPCWGAGVSFFVMCLQSKILELAHDATDLATSMFAATFNIGIGGGAFVGSLVLEQLDGTAGYSGLFLTAWVGAAFVAVALVLFLGFTLPLWRQAQIKQAQTKDL